MDDDTEVTVQRRLYESGVRARLSGLAGRDALLPRLHAAILHARHRGQELAFLVIDVDHFHQVNDAFGRDAGDQVLCALVLATEEMLREGDLIARDGGDELFVLTRATRDEAIALAERLRDRLAQVRVDVGGGSITATVSIGVAFLSECGVSSSTGRELVRLAESRVAAAKLAGRNRVCPSVSPSPDSGVAAVPDSERRRQLARELGLVVETLTRTVSSR
jgi:diguanylate cyclase (GGDEF)-like protein